MECINLGGINSWPFDKLNDLINITSHPRPKEVFLEHINGLVDSKVVG